jgi:sugar/nucleoside kinase (ribokinase family)
VHFSFPARLFTPVRFVGVVGEDFPQPFREFLQRAEIDLAGLEIRKGSKTFRWSGEYESSTADAETREIQLNVLAEAGPKIPPAFADSSYIFLAATHPALQQDLVRQLTSPRLIVADTRDLWITSQREGLLKTLAMVHGAIMNDAEARLLTGEDNLVRAGRKILALGPKFCVLKKGENGAMLVTGDSVVALPAYPTEEVKDPTGAGDSFAGGMMGYLATHTEFNMDVLRSALAHGMITASFTIEDFSLRRIEKIGVSDIHERLRQYASMLALSCP